MSILLPFALAVLIAPGVESRSLGSRDAAAFLSNCFLAFHRALQRYRCRREFLQERGCNPRHSGMPALMCAAVNDVCAWLLPAVALTLIPYGSGAMPIAHRLVWLLAYLLTMICVARPFGQMVGASGGPRRPLIRDTGGGYGDDTELGGGYKKRLECILCLARSSKVSAFRA